MFKLAQGSGNQGGYCEPVAFTVPRKSELYQDDLYPDTFSGEASLDAEEWFTQGKNATPKLVRLEMGSKCFSIALQLIHVYEVGLQT